MSSTTDDLVFYNRLTWRARGDTPEQFAHLLEEHGGKPEILAYIQESLTDTVGVPDHAEKKHQLIDDYKARRNRFAPRKPIVPRPPSGPRR